MVLVWVFAHVYYFGLVLVCAGLVISREMGMKEEKVLIGFFWGKRRRSVGESFLLSDSSLSLAIKYKTDFLAFFKFILVI